MEDAPQKIKILKVIYHRHTQTELYLLVYNSN